VFQELDSRLNPTLRLMAQMPLRSLIEIDGFGGGYSHGRDYVPSRSTPDERRAWKMRFKLRAAARAHYPLFVISGEEVEHLDEEASLTIVDGIVGQILSRWEERRLIEEMLEQEADVLATMEPAQAHEHAQDLVLQAGVISDLEFDPLAQAVAEERQRCEERFGFGFGGFHKPWLYDPPLPDLGLYPTQDGLRQRIQAMKAADRVGAHVGVSTDNGRYVEATAWMRNIGQRHGLMPELVIEQVAEFLAVRRAMRLAEGGQLGLKHDHDVRAGVRSRGLGQSSAR
jgi:hypothetical protein